MSNRVLTASERRRRSALPGLVLVATAVAFVLAAAAGAADPPIASVGSPGDPATASVTSGGQADACVSEEHSGADPSNTEPVAINDRGCEAGSGSSAGGASGSGSTSGGSRPTGGSQGAATSGGRGSTAWVSATNAVGLKITRVRSLTRSTKLTFRFGMVVTVRDARGRLVRGGIVSISRVPGTRSTITGVYSNFTKRTGQAQIVVPVTKKMFGKRLFLKISARTPRAQAVTLRSVFLPRLR